jgi:hypothetical protein
MSEFNIFKIYLKIGLNVYYFNNILIIVLVLSQCLRIFSGESLLGEVRPMISCP